MQRGVLSVLALSFIACAIVMVSAQQRGQPATSGAYAARCASCHGAGMAGGSAPAILAFIRYHVDAEVTAAIRQRHAALSLSDAEAGQVLADVRSLAATNPAMATGGYTGRRAGGPGAAAAYTPPPAAPANAAAPSAPTSSGAGLTDMTPSTIKMADGRARSGVLLAQGDLDAT